MSPFLRPACRCPACGAPPRWRIADTEPGRYERDPPGRVVGTIQCHRCHTVYEVRAEAIQKAA